MSLLKCCMASHPPRACESAQLASLAMNAGTGPGAMSVAAAHATQVAPPSAEDLTLFTSLAAYADALDALPLELTRSFSDLRELDAVLGGMYISSALSIRTVIS